MRLVFPFDSVPGMFTSARTIVLTHDFEQSCRIFKVDTGQYARSVEDGQFYWWTPFAESPSQCHTQGFLNDRSHRASTLRCKSLGRSVQVVIQLNRDPHASMHISYAYSCQRQVMPHLMR